MILKSSACPPDPFGGQYAHADRATTIAENMENLRSITPHPFSWTLG